MNLDVNPNWTYRQAVVHLEALKLRYEECLASFSMWEYKERTAFIYRTRSLIYSTKCSFEWQKDRLWNYMNGSDNLNDIILSSLHYK